MIQILGLRKGTVFFDRQWRASSVIDLFKNLDYYIEQIPEKDRYNIFYTVSNTLGKAERDFDFQTVLAIDVDHCPEPEKAAHVICDHLGLAYNATGVVASGNGLHLIIQLDTPIDKKEYFKEKRPYYKLLCKRIQVALQASDVEGVYIPDEMDDSGRLIKKGTTADDKIWDHRRILRMPGTANKKPGKEDKECVLLQSHIEPQGVSLESLSGVPDVPVHQQYNKEAYKTYGTPDQGAILEGCDFLNWCKGSPGEVTEPLWYAMLSIFPLFDDGRTLAHVYSREHPSYTTEGTDLKYDQATVASGPRYCENINDLWGKCKSCKFYGKVKSPVAIKGADHIPTEKDGFHLRIQNSDPTKPPKYIPQPDDLVKYVAKKTPFKATIGGGVVWKFIGTHWEIFSPQELENIAETEYDPKPRNNTVNEFAKKLGRTNIFDIKWFDTASRGVINFHNGVLDLKTSIIEEHSFQYGFRAMLPFEYMPDAICPLFDTFMEQITCGDEDVELLLKEYVGYALSGEEIWTPAAVILHGDGANGKSTFMKLIKYLVGEGNYSELTLSEMADKQSLTQIEGKLINLGDETTVDGLAKSEVFKTLVDGGSIEVKYLYSNPYKIRNRAKLIVACNTMPYSNDTSFGLMRRLCIVPFNAIFTDKDADPFIVDKLQKEAPGIFNACLAVYNDAKKRGAFTKPKAAEKELARFRKDNNAVLSWKEEYVVEEKAGGFVSGRELFDHFARENEKNKGYPISHTKFTREFKKLLTISAHVRQKKVDGVNRSGFEDMRLITEF